MAQNKTVSVNIALTTTLTTNILNPTITSLAGPVGITLTQPYFLVRHIRAVNKTSNSATVSLWRGASGANAAGTEVYFQGTGVPANSYVDAFGLKRFDTGDFLVGGSGTATAITLEIEMEVGFS